MERFRDGKTPSSKDLRNLFLFCPIIRRRWPSSAAQNIGLCCSGSRPSGHYAIVGECPSRTGCSMTPVAISCSIACPRNSLPPTGPNGRSDRHEHLRTIHPGTTTSRVPLIGIFQSISCRQTRVEFPDDAPGGSAESNRSWYQVHGLPAGVTGNDPHRVHWLDKHHSCGSNRDIDGAACDIQSRSPRRLRRFADNNNLLLERTIHCLMRYLPSSADSRLSGMYDAILKSSPRFCWRRIFSPVGADNPTALSRIRRRSLSATNGQTGHLTDGKLFFGSIVCGRPRRLSRWIWR